MLSIVCDVGNTFCQAFIFVAITQGIVSKGKKLSKLKLFSLFAAISGTSITLTHSGFSSPFANFSMLMITMLLEVIFFKDSIKEAFIGFGTAYFTIALTAYFIVYFYINVLVPLNIAMAEDVQWLLFAYVPVWITYYFLYKFRRYIFNLALFFKNLRNSLVFIILIDIALVILDTLRLDWSIERMSMSFKFFIYLLSFIIFTAAVIFFANINSKAKEVEMLNNQLNEKIVELKKLKHDYGSEISSLYGLYQLKRYDSMGEILKEIVDRYQRMSMPIALECIVNPVVSSVLYSASNAGINVITIDDADYDELSLSDNELLKVLSNIVNNAVEALKNTENPTIKFKSYNTYDGIIINIINNGPKIPDQVMGKLFQSGFSTKTNNKGERGFGLCIVKDIINKCGGNIKVYSNDQYTQFKLEIPKSRLRKVNTNI